MVHPGIHILDNFLRKIKDQYSPFLEERSQILFFKQMSLYHLVRKSQVLIEGIEGINL